VNDPYKIELDNSCCDPNKCPCGKVEEAALMKLKILPSRNAVQGSADPEVDNADATVLN
jgi:hypothetical protein